MKPVDKGKSLGTLNHYRDAKPELLNRVGCHCSYCEQAASPQDLHVEHIYPKDPHPERKNDWDNFLVACSSCNTYKHHHLGSARQVDLESRYLWPHRENTFQAFEYFADGRVEVATQLPGALQSSAAKTLEMVGAKNSPAIAASYKALSIPYDGIEKRKEMWDIASEAKTEYLAANGHQSPQSLARRAAKMGYFSIWMNVFNDCPEVRKTLILEFKAAPACFDANGQPLVRGRL